MGTVAKALSLLDLFTMSRTEIGLSDMARLSGMNKATVYRLLGELQAQGFVEQTGAERSYRLGPGILRLASLREAAVPLVELSRAVLCDLSDQTGETAHMSVRRGTRLFTLAYTYSRAHATKVTMEDAEELAFHATGSGLAVLAFSDPDFVASILSAPLQRFTPQTETDPDRLRTMLQDIRAQGIAESVGGFERDVHSHAAPVFGPDRHPIGALAIAAPSARIDADASEAIRTHLIHAAGTLTNRIGGFFPANHPLEHAA